MKKTILLGLIVISSTTMFACSSSKSSDPANQVLDENIFKEATSAGSLARCKDILDSKLKSSCQQVVQDQKVTGEAVKDLDKAKCSKVADERYQKDCETQVNAKLEAKNADAKRLTIEQKSLDKGDADICDGIADPNQKGACKYNILANQALQKKDPSLCEKIGLKNMIEDCKKYVKSESH